MVAIPLDSTSTDDPRVLRDLLGKARSLAAEHDLHSVLVGLSGFEGDLHFPEVVDFVESALRVDDSVFRMTRERAVLLLTDVDQTRAAGILQRLLDDFQENFPSPTPPSVGLGFFEVGPDTNELSAKNVLPTIFAAAPISH